MAEFKIAKALSDEISAAQDSGNLLNDGFKAVSKEDVKTLSAAVSYISQHKKIKELLDLYKALVNKDTQDMHQMVAEAEKMDNSIGT